MDPTLPLVTPTRHRRLDVHAPAMAARLVELADRLERSDDWHDILDALACRNMAAILRR